MLPFIFLVNVDTVSACWHLMEFGYVASISEAHAAFSPDDGGSICCWENTSNTVHFHMVPAPQNMTTLTVNHCKSIVSFVFLLHSHNIAKSTCIILSGFCHSSLLYFILPLLNVLICILRTLFLVHTVCSVLFYCCPVPSSS